MRAPPTRTTAAAEPEAPSSPAALLPAGDLDGNGSADVLDVRYRPGRRASTLGIVARGGTTGAVVWSRSIAVNAGHLAFPLPVRTGTDGRPGVVVYDLAFVSSSDGTSSTTTATLSGLSGRTGSTLWHRADTGRTSSTETTATSSQTLLQGLFESPSGAAQLLLVRTDATYAAGPAGDRQSGTTTALRVDGATGRATTLGEPVHSDDAVPVAVGVPDVTGDRLGDTAFLVGGSASAVTVRSGTDGAEAWTRTGTPLYGDAALVPVGPVAGSVATDRLVPDLALSTGTPETVVGTIPSPATPQHGSVVLLGGNDGREVTRVTGDRAVELVRAGDGPAFGVATDDSDDDGTATSAVLTVAAHRVDGTQLWTHTERLSGPSGGGFALGAAQSFGDLTRDGSLDVQALLVVEGDDGGDRERGVLLDGRTGRVLPYGAVDPLSGHLSSHGDDLVGVAPGDGVLVSGVSGRTGRAAFRTRLGAGTRLASGVAVAGGSGRCEDVLVSASGPSTDVAGVLRADGRLRWSVSGPTARSEVRPVTRYRLPAQRCS